MNKLLSAEFVRLFKSRLFKICVIISGAIGALFIIPRWIEVKRHTDAYANLPDAYSRSDDLLFMGTMFVIFIIATFIGLFVGTEYSDGTIRNKLIVGHKRSSIYISKLIVCVTANVIMHVVCIFVAWGLGSLLLGVTIGYGNILKNTIIGCAAIIALTAMLLLFSMSIQSKSIGSVICLIFMLSILLFSSVIMQRLDEPEYYEGYVFLDDETGEIIEEEPEKNPRYLTGYTRDIYEFLFDVLPTGQLMQIMILENVGSVMLYDFAILIVTTSAGIFIFKRKNLK